MKLIGFIVLIIWLLGAVGLIDVQVYVGPSGAAQAWHVKKAMELTK